MNWLDALLLLTIVISVVLGIKRGLVRVSVGLLATIVGVVAGALVLSAGRRVLPSLRRPAAVGQPARLPGDSAGHRHHWPHRPPASSTRCSKRWGWAGWTVRWAVSSAWCAASSSPWCCSPRCWPSTPASPRKPWWNLAWRPTWWVGSEGALPSGSAGDAPVLRTRLQPGAALLGGPVQAGSEGTAQVADLSRIGGRPAMDDKIGFGTHHL